MAPKYNIVLVDCVSFETKILKTTDQLNDATEFMIKYSAETFKINKNDWVKSNQENDLTLAIYQYYYFFPKVLTHKIQIIKFDDYVVGKPESIPYEPHPQ